MAVSEGRLGKVTVYLAADAKFKPGMLDPGEVTFSGFYDASDTTGQVQLITSLSSGGQISNSSDYPLKQMRFWANDDTTFDGFGYWSASGSSGELYITSLETGTNKDGIATISFTAKVSKGALAWSTIQATT
jgi:hypothetical protein